MIIKGWGSVFNEHDSNDDMTIKGSFVADLKTNTFVRPILFSHDVKHVIGVWDLIEERDFGLWCEGRILDEGMKDLIKEKALTGLSMGYRGIKVKHEMGSRKLLEVELEEVSLTAVPMCRSARIVECSAW